MERRALLLTLALTLPLALYGVPYVYASVATSDHVVHDLVGGASSIVTVNVLCPPGDYAVSGGYKPQSTSTAAGVHSDPQFLSTFPTLGGNLLSTGQTPDGWKFEAFANGPGSPAFGDVWVVCQTPVLVGGVSVPQFGSLYVAIALGAVVYFMLSRHFTRRPAVSAQVEA